MDVLTHNVANRTIDDFLRSTSNYLFETDAGYVALLSDPDTRPFSMFRPFYIKPDEVRDCWLVKDVFRKWAGKFRLIAVVPGHRVKTFTQQLSQIARKETRVVASSA